MSDEGMFEAKLPADSFPFTIEFVQEDEVVAVIRVTEPTAVTIPAFTKPVSIRMRFADGHVSEAHPQ